MEKWEQEPKMKKKKKVRQRQKEDKTKTTHKGTPLYLRLVSQELEPGWTGRFVR